MFFNADSKGKASALAHYINLNVNTSFATMEKYIRRAELKYIVPLLSKAFYDEFNQGFNENTLAGKELELLVLVQDALANYVYFMSLDDLGVKASDIGIVLELSEEVEHISEERIFFLKKQAAQTADELAEEVLKFLEANAADFPTWKASEAYTESKELFINNATEYTILVPLIGNSRRIYLRLRPTIIDVEEINIRDVLGNDFFEELKASYQSEEGLDDYENIVWTKVQKIVAYLALAKELPLLQAVFSEQTTLIMPSFGYFGKRERELNLGEMRNVAYEYSQKAEPFITQLIDYLNKNADLFPIFKNSSRYVKPLETDANAGFDYANSNVFPIM